MRLLVPILTILLALAPSQPSAGVVGHGARATLVAAAEPVTLEPNRYELAGPGVRVTYTTESGRAQPRPTLSYQDRSRSRLFTGDEVRVRATELGTLVTVTLRAVPDLSTTTFTLVVPGVNLGPDNQAAVRTFGVTTVHRLPFLIDPAPPQVDEYRTVRLAGTARYIAF